MTSLSLIATRIRPKPLIDKGVLVIITSFGSGCGLRLMVSNYIFGGLLVLNESHNVRLTEKSEF